MSQALCVASLLAQSPKGERHQHDVISPTPTCDNMKRPDSKRRPLQSFIIIASLIALTVLGCGIEVEGPEPPEGVLYSPVGIALHPNGKYLYVVNSNFDLNYREDRGGSVVVVDTDDLTISPYKLSGVQIGSFGGDIKLNDPADGQPTRAFVAVRGNRSVTVLNIEDNGSKLSCDGRSLSTLCEITTNNEDPFGLDVATFTTELEAAGSTELDFVAVTHLLGTDVTTFTLKSGPVDAQPFSATLISGANDIARSPRTGQFYATNRFSGSVTAFRPVFDLNADVTAIVKTGDIFIENAQPYSGLDSRAIAFNGDGTRAFITNRGPRSLLIADVGPSNLEANSGTRNRVIDAITLPQDPADLAVISTGDADLIYVASYESSVISVINPRTRTIVDSIKIPGEPYAMAVDQNRHQRIYVSLFADNAIAVVDIDPTSPSFNQVVSVIQ